MDNVDLEKSIKLPLALKIRNVQTNLAHTLALLEDNKTLLYWGFNWDIRSFYRTSMMFQAIPNFMKFLQMVWPPLKTFPCSPSILNVFHEEIVDMSVGGAHCIFLDSEGSLHSIGDNSFGQIGNVDLNTTYTVSRIITPNKLKFKKISAGFQHTLALDEFGMVHGCGKCDKYQLGSNYFESHMNNKDLFVKGTGLVKLNFQEIKEANIIDIAAGKYHSIILTDSGSVYAVGVNRFGQIGESNLNLKLSEHLIKIEFPDNEKIVKIQVGDNHNLMLSENGKLFSNGDNSAGQVDGDLDNFIYYYCTPKQIILPDESPIIKIYAKNNRSAALLENGKCYYWGGFAYDNQYPLNNQPKYDGFNIFNTEEGFPKNGRVLDVGLGIFHDILLVQI